MSFWLRVALFAGLLVAWPAASSARADDEPAPFVKITPADGDTFVFLGDSITAQGLYTQYLETYFYTRYPQLRLKFHKRCSTIDVARGKRDAAVVKVTGGKVTDAHYTADGLEFTFHPQCLPLPVPEPARIGAGLIPLGHRLSYEAIYLHGLPAGNYGLSIDDTPIGTYAAATLESKLELESIETTPEYRQAVEVMELNARRNTEAVLPLRDLWRAQKTLTRTRGELAAAPSDEALKKRITAYERKLSNFEEQIATWETKARELEEQIYEANRPRPLRFRLIRRAD